MFANVVPTFRSAGKHGRSTRAKTYLGRLPTLVARARAANVSVPVWANDPISGLSILISVRDRILFNSVSKKACARFGYYARIRVVINPFSERDIFPRQKMSYLWANRANFLTRCQLLRTHYFFR